ncbi:MAG: hypothetical protein ACOYJK_08015 [Prevotella sp.]|jgi:hypothetical protein
MTKVKYESPRITVINACCEPMLAGSGHSQPHMGASKESDFFEWEDEDDPWDNEDALESEAGHFPSIF